MLPENLSNVVCSLVPYKDRLTFSVLVEMTPLAKIVSYEIKKTIINSKRRFTYEEVQQIIEKGDGDFKDEIFLLNDLAKKLRSKRIKKGSINFFSPEVNFILDKNGIPVEIKIKEERESNNLIEEMMLLANQIVAGHLKPKKNNLQLPFVYRIHDLPDKEKIIEFSRFVKSLGYTFDPNSANRNNFRNYLKAVKGQKKKLLLTKWL